MHPHYFPKQPVRVNTEQHSMEASLLPYLELKVHPLIRESGGTLRVIRVIPMYDRTRGSLSMEKPGKLLNFKRPTVELVEDTAIVRCFPGRDYIFQFASVVASYAEMQGWKTRVEMDMPDEATCNAAFRQSFVNGTRGLSGKIAVVGKVEGLDALCGEMDWQGTGDFLWKNFQIGTLECALIGCQHTIWGEIAGRFVRELSSIGFTAVIYVGKLGSLYSEDVPSQTLATGDMSILPDGSVVRWRNLFAAEEETVAMGTHITLPSVLQETKSWLDTWSEARFVDPEIGHMAYAAELAGIEFSYLHMVSDNVRNRSYRLDLSNERVAEALHGRDRLYQDTTRILAHAIRRRYAAPLELSTVKTASNSLLIANGSTSSGEMCPWINLK